jgi:hippurate hydrolase
LAQKKSASTGVGGYRSLSTFFAGLFLAASLLTRAAVQEDPRELVKARVAEEYPTLFALYQHLHANPELSLREAKTAARIAEEWRHAGYEVTEKVGGHGVVGVLRNGAGPTLLLRTDLDALPVTEKTGLPHASKVRATDDRGNEVDVMHACGHDAHMTVLVGTARVLSRLRNHWRGTLVLIGQPAEETGAGAKAMLADGLFTRFPKPDWCFAWHVKSEVPAGMVAFTEGAAFANVDSVDITVYGVGGHGSAPQTTRDPVVLAAQIVLALQTIVSRELTPGEPAVLTVGSIHGGTKHNIIPDEVRLQLTLRSYSRETRDRMITAIRRITRGLGLAAGLPEDRLPLVAVGGAGLPAAYNDPKLTRRLTAVFKDWLGERQVREVKPTMGGEDFGLYGQTADRIPISLFWLGISDPTTVTESEKSGQPLPSAHSSLFAPVPEPTIKTGVTAMTAAVLELLRPQ